MASFFSYPRNDTISAENFIRLHDDIARIRILIDHLYRTVLTVNNNPSARIAVARMRDIKSVTNDVISYLSPHSMTSFIGGKSHKNNRKTKTKNKKLILRKTQKNRMK